MSNVIEKELLEYYRDYCDLTIRFKKLMLQVNKDYPVSIEEVSKELFAERNKLLSYFPTDRRRLLRIQLNRIATSFYSKVSNWPKKQIVPTDIT